MAPPRTYIEDLLDLDSSDGDEDVAMFDASLPKAIINKKHNVKNYAREMAAQRENQHSYDNNHRNQMRRTFENYESEMPFPSPTSTPTQQPLSKNISEMEIAEFVAASYSIAQFLKNNDGNAYRHCSGFYDSDKTVYILIIIILVIICLLLLKKCLDV